MNFVAPLVQYEWVESSGKHQSIGHRAWLLFPIARPYLSAEYAHHYSLLVYALHILLSSSISPHDLVNYFFERYITFNVHNLMHLVPLVKQWGPLWVYYCFRYESMVILKNCFTEHIRFLYSQLKHSSLKCKLLNPASKSVVLAGEKGDRFPHLSTKCWLNTSRS